MATRLLRRRPPGARALQVLACLAALALGSPAAARSHHSKAHPQTVLRKGQKYLFLTPRSWPTAPDIAIFKDKGLKGRPFMQVSGEGLFVNGKKLCQWPRGAFEKAAWTDMVLGYDAAMNYKGCGKGLPVLSTWGDAGTGSAVIYIAFKREKDGVYELRYKGKKVYLSKAQLPKDVKVIDGADVHKEEI